MHIMRRTKISGRDCCILKDKLVVDVGVIASLLLTASVTGALIFDFITDSLASMALVISISMGWVEGEACLLRHLVLHEEHS